VAIAAGGLFYYYVAVVALVEATAAANLPKKQKGNTPFCFFCMINRKMLA
jgi:hypothetical protein